MTKHRTLRRGQPFALASWRRLLPSLLIAYFAWRIIAHGLADLLSESDPQTALFWDPANPAALTKLAQDQLENFQEGDPRVAADYAARLVTKDPLAPGALSLLGVAKARLGETKRADEILRVAAAHLPIDLIAHGWLYEQALKNGDVSAALTELDILLRGRPFITAQLGPSVQSLIGASAEAEAGFASLLAFSPPWRASLLEYLSNNIGNADTLVRLFGRLQKSASPPSTGELRPFLTRLVREGKIEQAYLAWLDQLPPERLSRLGLLYNNRFQFPVSNLPFDWQITQVSGAKVEVVQDDKEPYLSLEFYGARVNFANVSHLLMLPPGSYVFSGVGKTENLENDRGLRWRIYCLSDPGGSLAQTNLLTGTTPLDAFRVNFSVPPTGCEAQALVLEIPARIALELQVSGAARYSKLSIGRLDTAAQ